MGNKNNQRRVVWKPEPKLQEELRRHGLVKTFNRFFAEYKKQGMPRSEAAEKAYLHVTGKNKPEDQIARVIEKLKQDEKDAAERASFPSPLEKRNFGFEGGLRKLAGPLLSDIADEIGGGLKRVGKKLPGHFVTGLEQVGRPIAEPIVKVSDQLSKLRWPSTEDLWNAFVYDDDPWRVFSEDPENELELDFYRRNKHKIHSEDPEVRSRYRRSLTEKEISKGYGTREFREKMSALDDRLWEQDALRNRRSLEKIREEKANERRFAAWKHAKRSKERERQRYRKSISLSSPHRLDLTWAIDPMTKDRAMREIRAKEQLEREGHLDTPAFTATKTGIYPSETVGQRYIDPSEEIEFDENQRISRKYGGSPLADPGAFNKWRESVTPFFRDKWREERNQKIRDDLGLAPDYSNIDANLEAADRLARESRDWFRENPELAPRPSLSLQLSHRDEGKRQRGADIIGRSQVEKWLERDKPGSAVKNYPVVPEYAMDYLTRKPYSPSLPWNY